MSEGGVSGASSASSGPSGARGPSGASGPSGGSPSGSPNSEVSAAADGVQNTGAQTAQVTGPGDGFEARTTGDTPGATPGGTPSATPDATPTAGPGAAPSATPDATPTAAPGATPAATPGATPAAAPGSPDPNGAIVGAGAAERVTPATPTAEKVPGMTISDEQFGKKIGKHASDFGLDPSNPQHREQLRGRIESIAQNPDEVRRGPWRGAGNEPHNFFRQGNDVVVAKGNGQFVTVLKDGVNNGFFKGAAPVAETAGALARAAPVLRGIGRAALPVGAAVDAYTIATSENPGRTAVEKAGAWGTSLGAAGLAAQAGAPLLAGGPLGWIGYGGLVVGAGALGYFGGEAATSRVIDWFSGR